MTEDRTGFPFAAVVGMERARQALLYLAVDRGLRGVLLAGGPGTAKSLLVRSFRVFVERFVEAPASVTEDALLGGLNLERMLVTGKREPAHGVLARAHGGVLYVDGIDLLDRGAAQQIAMSLSDGVVRLEREGVSATIPSDFALVGTYDPGEGGPGAPLLEAAGVHVFERDELSSERRLELLRRAAAYDRDPRAFVSQSAAATATLRRLIAAARERLPHVLMDSDGYRRLSREAQRLNVEGHRADLFAARLARVSAAWNARSSVQEEDIEAALEFVLLPRAGPVVGTQGSAPSTRGRESHSPAAGAAGPAEEFPAPAHDSEAPAGALELPPLPKGELTQQPAGRRMGPHGVVSWDRGRYVRAVMRTPGRGKIALEATLRAAAVRRGSVSIPRVTADDLRFKQFKQKSGMLIVFAVDASGSMGLNRIHQAKGAMLRLLREAYLHRDRVALVSFRGDRAHVLLEPSRSVELARRALDAQPVGGGTPMAAGLQAARDLILRSRLTGARQALLVILTDGRANVPAGKEHGIWQELERVGAALAAERVPSVVIDTSNYAISGGQAERLAAMLGGRHLYLPRAGAAGVSDAILTVTGDVRGAC